MRSQKSSRIAVMAVFSAMLLVLNVVALAQTETVIHTFSGTDGELPILGLTFDSAGNLYGVTAQGGSSNNGTVFQLVPNPWTLTTLLSFNGGAGGSTPSGAVIVESPGKIYGTTKLGGSNGAGVVFELSEATSGKWTETVLHNFGSGKDGQYPCGSVVFDSAGNIYGTTQAGGAYGHGTNTTGGTAYKLTPKSGGGWTETVIHSFGSGTDGALPRANLVIDSVGNLYGTTYAGGQYGKGTVFELSPQSGGGWKEQVLHTFQNNGVDGFEPIAGLIFDSNGNLYGTTVDGGSGYGGTVFELSPQSGGSWTETVLYNFYWLYPDELPYSGVVFDSAGNLYGANLGRPNYNGEYGVVYKLTPQSGPSWLEKDLYTFDGPHGSEPAIGSLAIDSAGNIYGATQAGGSSKDGVIFKVTP
jgi:uncharacterized repeat protein (TIGR03803 family)